MVDDRDDPEDTELIEVEELDPPLEDELEICELELVVTEEVG